MKDKIALLLLGIFVICFSSCLGNDDESTYIPSGDAQVYYFHLQNDSIPALDSVKFTIDQLNGKIYNPDSMPYGTVIKEKVVCTFTTRGVAGIQVKQTALADTLSWWNTTDSLDFTRPVEFVVTPMDGIHKKPYTAWINIHTVNPDSMAWRRLAEGIYPPVESADLYNKPVVMMSPDSTEYWMFATAIESGRNTYSLYKAPLSGPADWRLETDHIAFPYDASLGESAPVVRLDQMVWWNDTLIVPQQSGMAQTQLYKSANGKDWEKVPLADTPFIQTILGVVGMPGRDNYLCTVALTPSGQLAFCRTPDLTTWEFEESEMPSGFPAGGNFASLSYENMYHPYLLLVGGRESQNGALLNTAWNTSDGLNWIKYESVLSPFDQPREGAMLTPYDGKFYLIGGTDAAGQTTRSIVYSTDRGLSWKPVDDLKVFPADYNARSFASVHVDKENNLLLFGGRESASSAWLDEVWSGKINRLGFAEPGN